MRCTCVCPSMSVHAARLSGDRSAARLRLLPHSYLNLPPLAEGQPVGPEDPPDDPSAFGGGVAASRPALPPFSLPPALGTSIFGRVRLRSELRIRPEDGCRPAPLRELYVLTRAPSNQLPPDFQISCDRPSRRWIVMARSFAVFGALALLCPTSASNVTGQSAGRWNYVQPASAAVASWRVAGAPARFSAEDGLRRWGRFGAVCNARCFTLPRKGPFLSEGNARGA